MSNNMLVDYIMMLLHVKNPKNEEGASAVEYGLLVALIAAVIVLAVYALGQLLNTVFEDTCASIASGSGTGSC